MNNTKKSALASLVLGATLALSPLAHADGHGSKLPCAEGDCGSKKASKVEGSCGSGGCGAAKETMMKKEGSCGAGACGSNK